MLLVATRTAQVGEVPMNIDVRASDRTNERAREGGEKRTKHTERCRLTSSLELRSLVDERARRCVPIL